jgi:hypothetical protein
MVQLAHLYGSARIEPKACDWVHEPARGRSKVCYGFVSLRFVRFSDIVQVFLMRCTHMQYVLLARPFESTIELAQ